MQWSRPVHLRGACLSSPMINDLRDSPGQPLDLCSIDSGPPFTGDVRQHLRASSVLVCAVRISSDILEMKYVLRLLELNCYLLLVGVSTVCNGTMCCYALICMFLSR